MINFFKKVYSIFLRQNSWWLEQFEAPPSHPLLFGFTLSIGYFIVIALFNLTPTIEITGIILGVSSILISLSGILSIREKNFPFYITGIFRGSHRYQKTQAIIWSVFWGGMGLLIIFSTFME